jgi:DNA-binding CsgD family transcriptional regulator
MADEARRLATEGLRTATDPAVRVHLRLLLIDLAGQDQSQVAPLLDEAYTDAGTDPALGAKVRLYRGIKAVYDGDVATANTELQWARHLAELGGDTETLVRALAMLGFRPIAVGEQADAMLAQAAAISQSLPLSSSVIEVRNLHAAALIRRGKVGDALRELESLRAAVERSGSVIDLSQMLLALTSVYVRAGRFTDALNTGRACLRLFTDVEGTPGPGLIIGTMAEMHAGSLAIAARHSEEAIAACLAAGDEEWLPAAYSSRGQILMLQGDPVEAIEPMRLAYAIQTRRGMLDPGSSMWYPDFIEALVSAGARAEAARVLAEVTVRADEFDRIHSRLGLARASGILTAADGDPRAGSAEIVAALESWPQHPYPLEIARAWHSLGTIERRAHRRGAAREAFGEAARRYSQLGAQTWFAAVDGELAKLNGPRGMGLSETEQRIVDLVRRGCTNREIARATFLSVKAIEANLTRLYRRFGVRNRDQLSRAVAELSAD